MSPITEQVFLGQQPTFAGRQILASPFQFEFTGEDRLAFTVQSSVATTVVVTLRFVRDSGVIDVAQHPFSVEGNRVPHTISVAVGRGYVSNVVVRPVISTVQIGQCYVKVFVVRTGGTAPGLIIGQMLGGYTTLQSPLAWPGSAIVASVEGRGALVSVIAPGPGAGVQHHIVVPINTRWSPLSVFAAYVADATPGDRFVALLYGSISTNWGRYMQRAPVPALAGVAFTWARGLAQMPAVVANLGATAPIPIETYLPADAFIDTMVSGVGVNDFWGPAELIVEEWLMV